MPAGSNLSGKELEQLQELLQAWSVSQEFMDQAGEPEDLVVVEGTLSLINYARVSRPEEE